MSVGVSGVVAWASLAVASKRFDVFDWPLFASGGVVVLGTGALLVGFVKAPDASATQPQVQASGAGSINVQAGRDAHVSSSDMDQGRKA